MVSAMELNKEMDAQVERWWKKWWRKKVEEEVEKNAKEGECRLLILKKGEGGCCTYIEG